ncbi:MAG: hypothetical protein H0W84_12665 [Bacteroidetes bacterium]|nr:hypothetical protein [Bacteroidota bacterium]
MPSIARDDDIECTEEEKAGFALKNFLAKHGIAICKLEIPKARDGMQKFNLLIEFHFHKNIFKKLDLNALRKLSPKPDKWF